MTLGEAKKQVLGLLDDYSAGGEITRDPDVELRFNALFDAAQKAIAAKTPIRKRITVKAGTFTPDNRIIRCLGFYDINGARIFPEWCGDTVMLTDDTVIDALCAPEDITDETPDDYLFEIKEALCPAMVYFVAASLNIVDLVVSPQYLMSCFDRIVSFSQATPYTGTVSAL